LCCWFLLKEHPRELFAFLNGRGWVGRKIIHFFWGRAKDGNDTLKRFDRGVAFAPFESLDRPFADFYRVGQRFLGEPAALPKLPKGVSVTVLRVHLPGRSQLLSRGSSAATGAPLPALVAPPALPFR